MEIPGKLVVRTYAPARRWVVAAIMVLLGGLESLSGPVVGVGIYAVLQDTVMRQTQYWHALLGVIILVLVLVFPGGVVGFFAKRLTARRKIL